MEKTRPIVDEAISNSVTKTNGTSLTAYAKALHAKEFCSKKQTIRAGKESLAIAA